MRKPAEKSFERKICVHFPPTGCMFFIHRLSRFVYNYKVNINSARGKKCIEYSKEIPIIIKVCFFSTPATTSWLFTRFYILSKSHRKAFKWKEIDSRLRPIYDFISSVEEKWQNISIKTIWWIRFKL